MSEDRAKSAIEDLRNSMEEYLHKSADFVSDNTQTHQDRKSQPSLTVSEFQIHSEATSLSMPTRTTNKYTKFYQFLFISIMIASIAIIISLIVRFYELKRHHARQTAFYQYIHHAVDIKHHHPNMSLFHACHKAIHHENIRKLYKAASVEVKDLHVDIEELIESQKNNKTKSVKINKKQELIIMCEYEVSLLQKATIKRAEGIAKAQAITTASKSHRDAYYQYLQQAIKLKQEHPKDSMMTVCNKAIDHENIKDLWKMANIDVPTLKVDIKELHKELNIERNKNDRKLNQKEYLVIMCQVEMTMMTDAMEEEIQQHRQKNPIKSKKVKEEPTKEPSITIEVDSD